MLFSEIITLNPRFVKKVNPNSKNRITKLPRGSEGSLQYNIQKISEDEIILNVYGNLRDFSNAGRIYDWLNEYTYQIVINKKYLEKELLDVIEADNVTTLAPWDPMGALA